MAGTIGEWTSIMWMSDVVSGRRLNRVRHIDAVPPEVSPHLTDADQGVQHLAVADQPVAGPTHETVASVIAQPME